MRAVRLKKPSAPKTPSKILIIAALAVVAGSYLYFKLASGNEPKPSSAIGSSSAKHFDKNQHSTGDPASLWVVVNKGRQLPADFRPQGLITPKVPLRFSAGSPEMLLRQDAAKSLQELMVAAKTDRIQLMLASGYRSFGDQAAIYQRNVGLDGLAKTDATSARAGHSEHQTGLAADIEPLSRECEIEVCFGLMKEGQWLAENSFKFGFVIRYPKGKQNLTGYEYEPWHIRYVGSALAAQLASLSLTLEQFFNLPTYPDYPNHPIPL